MFRTLHFVLHRDVAPVLMLKIGHWIHIDTGVLIVSFETNTIVEIFEYALLHLVPGFFSPIGKGTRRTTHRSLLRLFNLSFYDFSLIPNRPKKFSVFLFEQTYSVLTLYILSFIRSFVQ